MRMGLLESIGIVACICSCLFTVGALAEKEKLCYIGLGGLIVIAGGLLLSGGIAALIKGIESIT